MAKEVRTAMAPLLIIAWGTMGQPLLGEVVLSGGAYAENETKQRLMRLVGAFVKHSVLEEIG